MRGMRITLIALPLLFAWTSVACKSPECESARDCVDPLVCENNVCVKNTSGTPPSGVDGSVYDGGIEADGGDATVGMDADDSGVPTADGGDAQPNPDATPLDDAGRILFDSGID